MSDTDTHLPLPDLNAADSTETTYQLASRFAAEFVCVVFGPLEQPAKSSASSVAMGENRRDFTPRT